VTAGRKQVMQKSIVRKGLVLGIILLFVGAGATPIIGVNLASKNTKNTNDFDDSMLKTNQTGEFSKHQPRTLNKESMTSGTIKEDRTPTVPLRIRWNAHDIVLRYTCVVQNIGNDTVDIVTYLAHPKPHENQEINLDIVYNPVPDGFETDRWEQKIAYFNYSLIPQQKITLSWELNATTYTMRYFLFPWRVRGEIPEHILQKYTADDELYKINDPYIQNVVKEIVGDTKHILFKAIKLHDYIVNNLEYNNDWHWDDAVTTLKRGNGSCSDYCFAYIALCRAVGIPARYKGGTILSGKIPYSDTLFHRIAEIYLPSYGWVPVDPTLDDFQEIFRRFFFGYHGNKFFVLTTGGGSSKFLGWSYHYWHSTSSPLNNIRTDCSVNWS